jgi:hypothetical protein
MWANTARWLQEKAVDVAQRANVAAEEVRLTCVAWLLRCFCHFVPVISCHSSAVLRFHNIIFNLSAFSMCLREDLLFTQSLGARWLGLMCCS